MLCDWLNILLRPAHNYTAMEFLHMGDKAKLAIANNNITHS